MYPASGVTDTLELRANSGDGYTGLLNWYVCEVVLSSVDMEGLSFHFHKE
jgi:hypothetical protein